MSSDLGVKIKNRRIELNMTQDELANKVGYTNRTTICKIESGKNDIPRNKLLKFAEALKVPPNYLFDERSKSLESGFDSLKRYMIEQDPAGVNKILNAWEDNQRKKHELYELVSSMYNTDTASHIMMLIDLKPSVRDDIFKKIEDAYITS